MIAFFVAIVLVLFLLIVHSYAKRGGRLTLVFFFFAFLWAFRKESALPFSLISPYKFSVASNLSTLAIFTATLGWIFTFYISWCISENILRHNILLKKGLFMTLLLCIFVTAAISYAVESTAVNIGWWKWTIVDKKFSDFFVPGYHYGAVVGWIGFTIFFLAPFFLIECSRYKNYIWKFAFFLIPCIYFGVYYLQNSVLIKIMNFLTINSIIIFTFLSPLELSCATKKDGLPQRIFKMINSLPIFAMIIMVSIVTFIDIMIIRKPDLLFSKAPSIFCIFLAMYDIPLPILLILAVVLIVFVGKLAVPTFILLSVVFIIKMVDYLKERLNLYSAMQDRFDSKTKIFLNKIFYVLAILVFIIFMYHILSPSHDAIFPKHYKDNIVLSGKVVFDKYKSGVIKIGVWSQPNFRPGPPDISRIQIERPGMFQLKAPKESGLVYLNAVNIPNVSFRWLNIPRRNMPSGVYKENPLEVKSEDIQGINIIME